MDDIHEEENEHEHIDDGGAAAGGNSKRRKKWTSGAKNTSRQSRLVKWLTQRFPEHFRRGEEGAHILEVAGGHGELAARLALCHGKTVVMIEPRPANLVEIFNRNVRKRLPKRRKERFNVLEEENKDFLHEKVREKITQVVAEFDEESLENDSRVRDAVANACLIVAMHPDKPTEAIVDAALRYRKPFVVLPCCVFPKHFPHRTVVMEEGQPGVPVRTHEQFCEYLLRKHPGFRRDNVDFNGRNVVIWWDGVSENATDTDDA